MELGINLQVRGQGTEQFVVTRDGPSADRASFLGHGWSRRSPTDRLGRTGPDWQTVMLEALLINVVQPDDPTTWQCGN